MRTFYRVAKIYCFMTYYPLFTLFFKILIDILSKIINIIIRLIENWKSGVNEWNKRIRIDFVVSR